MRVPKLRHEQRTEVPELKTNGKTTRRPSSVEGTCSRSCCKCWTAASAKANLDATQSAGVRLHEGAHKLMASTDLFDKPKIGLM